MDEKTRSKIYDIGLESPEELVSPLLFGYYALKDKGVTNDRDILVILEERYLPKPKRS